ncbi:HPF/RaiA family ribosome-associated protein [uncultured Xylophilus sp.]|uniref:HPF/RaiA family ribosome-associated protein n=1 Tax=uncultured Xylophilus sp. TaxID=296832 RepID=UPI0025E4EB39|nr:HPF/RaiA family ribosome-associated protein [uncultured Xylophilus sp.]
MQIQVNATSSLQGQNREALDRWADSELQTQLQRFRADVTRIEVHLSDENSTGKAGAGDKRSLLEARLANHPPIAASHHAPTLDEAFRGSIDKLKHALESTLDRQKKHRDRESIRFDTDTPVDDLPPTGSTLPN